MRVSKMFLPTLREAPSEAESLSHQLMLRAGMLRKQASGIYAFLPLGLRALKKIERIVREEMERAGAQELLMPALLPAESYKASGRWEVFGSEMFRMKDRSGREFCLGPTHEEIFTETVKNEIRSYRALPLVLYQIQTKYRDEIRPRFGVIRSREFIMKDAYSFDRDEAGLAESYRKMYEAYQCIFRRCGLDFLAVDADTGAMGGSGSQEFMASSEIGEAVIARCPSCGYAANIELAPFTGEPGAKDGGEKASTEGDHGEAALAAEGQGLLPLEKVATPNARTIEELIGFFRCSAALFAKTLIFKADDRIVAAMVRGDRELNEAKLQNHLRCTSLEMADAETVSRITGAEVGFAGPVGLKAELVADPQVAGLKNFIAGANQTGYHLKNVNAGRDFTPAAIVDITMVKEGDRCPECGSPVGLERGIEVGQIFKLGTKYSRALGCTYLDDQGAAHDMVMGCYGIGISRTLASVIEQNHDGDGIIWPMAVAPYQVIVVMINPAESAQRELAEALYRELQEAGIEVLLDDRDERAGIKFKDADLIGIPIRITVGKRAAEGIVECKMRGSVEKKELPVAEVLKEVRMAVG